MTFMKMYLFMEKSHNNGKCSAWGWTTHQISYLET